MRTRVAARLGLVAVCCSLAGCVSLKRTPEARFFVLRSLSEPAPPAAEPAASAVGVLPVRLPGHLQRPQVVTEAGPNELLIDEFARWAEPLGPATTRVLAENLAAVLADRMVMRHPWAADADLRCRVLVEVESFAPQADGEVRLAGRWTLLEPGGPRALVRRDFSLRRGPFPVGAAGMEPGAGAGAMSELLAELAGQVAAGVRELGAEETASGRGEQGSGRS